MSVEIVNGAPMVVDRGTQDLSIEQLSRLLVQIPQHLPIFFIAGAKGPTTRELVGGVDRENIYGSQTFSPTGKYFNHQTLFANRVNEEGNLQILQRLIPANAGPNSTLVFWLDVLETQVDDYERNQDGSIKVDNLGSPTVIGQIDGVRVKWVVTSYETSQDLLEGFGAQEQGEGNQTDGGGGTSTRYPIFEMRFNSQGLVGNLSGIRMWAPTVKTTETLPSKVFSEQRAYPYYMSVVRKADALSTPRVVNTLFDEQQIMVSFMENAVDPLTTDRINLQETFVDSYQNVTDTRYAKVFGDFDQMHVYQENVEFLLEKFHALEVPFIDSFSDFTADVADKHLFNFLQGQSSFGVAYHSFVFVDGDPDIVQFGQFNNHFAQGGSDGTWQDGEYESLVRDELARYIDPNDEVQDLAYNVESIFYDSGFSVQTKLEAACFVGLRKDTFVVLSTHTDGERELQASEQFSLGQQLRTRLRAFPESEYYGTGVMRGMVMGGSGKIRNGLYKKPVSTSYEVALKSAKYMGAANGAWKNGQSFDSAENGGSVLEELYDINIKWVPKSVRNRYWDIGLNWAGRFDRDQFFFPVLKTVCAEDTSVLNSYFTAMAIGQLNKIAHMAWRQYSGNQKLTDAQLCDAVNSFVLANIKDRFDGQFIIVPKAYMTEMDTKRGFSFTLPIQIGANNNRTVMTTYVQAYRQSALAAAA